MLGFDPEPSLTIVVFWTERLFRTHPPSKAAAPPERRSGPSAHPEYTVAPSQGYLWNTVQGEVGEFLSSQISVALDCRLVSLTHYRAIPEAIRNR